MDESSHIEEMIVDLRAAYAAFNRGDMDAAVGRLMLRSNGANLLSFQGAVRTTDATMRGGILRSHGQPGPK
jgi:hypothetical protein